MASSRCAITICRQQSIKPKKPKNRASIIKKNLNTAPTHNTAATAPNAIERLKEI